MEDQVNSVIVEHYLGQFHSQFLGNALLNQNLLELLLVNNIMSLRTGNQMFIKAKSKEDSGIESGVYLNDTLLE